MDDSNYKQPLTHSQLKNMVGRFLDQNRQNAAHCRRDRDYYDGDQISAEVRAELSKRGQPPIYTNKIFPAVNGLWGILDAGVSDPEAFPRTARSQDAADVATKALRYVADRAQYKQVRKIASEPFLIQGTAAIIVGFDGEHVTVEPILWEDFLYDSYSRMHDFSDSKWMGIGKKLDVDDVDEMFPETFAALGKPTGDGMGSFFDDDTKREWWGDHRKRVRVCDIHYEHGGEWHRAIFCEAGMLYAGPGELHDDLGNSICPIEGVSAEVSRKGDRYGIVRHMIPLQDEVNARRSRLLHLVNHRQVQVTDMYAAATDKDIARAEASKADGVLPYGYSASPSADLAQGQMQILQQADSDLDRMCPTPAVLGRVTANGESGRARQILQQAGYTELARIFGRFENFEHNIYRKMWFAAREYVDQPTWIRIADNPRSIEFMQVNEPVMGMAPAPAINPSTGEPMIDPYSGQQQMVMRQTVVGYRNRLAELDMDIILSTVPDTQTLEQEVWDKLMETIGSLGLSPDDPKLLIILEMMPLPNRRQTIDRIKLAIQSSQESAAGQQQAQMEAAMAATQSDQAVKNAKAAKDGALAKKTEVETSLMIGQAEQQNMMQRLAAQQAFAPPF